MSKKVFYITVGVIAILNGVIDLSLLESFSLIGVLRLTVYICSGAFLIYFFIYEFNDRE